jgi:CheY-like chemotaxis protein
MELQKDCYTGLLTVINDILDFSKIEAQKLTLEALDFDLLEVVEDAVEICSGQSYSKAIDLAEFLEPDVPINLRGDPGRLRQVLTNLLGNAVKFTTQGEVVLTISKAAETASGVLLRFEVRDSGIGMTQEVQSRLFQAFNQADGSMTRKYGGTGLGLAICKQLVTMMKGEIGVISQSGSGSTFWFTIQLEKQMVVQDAPSADPVLAGVRVLVVDDKYPNRSILQSHLSAMNMEVVSAASGREALEFLEWAATDKPFRLAILAMDMPEMDGLALARALKAWPWTALIHVVLLTSLGEILSDEAAKSIDACLVKPVKRSRLYDCLAKIIASQDAESPKVVECVQPVLDTERRQAVRFLLAEDNPVNRVVALSQLEQMGYVADVTSDGLEVLELLRHTPYDIILMDCQMPHMDGFETTSRIRAAGNNPHRPYIIALTAHATQMASESCLAAGMNDYISKPVKFAAFAAAIAKGISALWGDDKAKP